MAAVVLFGVGAPVTSARADLIASGNQLWQQGAAGLVDQPESESRIPLADAGVFRTRGDGFGSAVASGDFNGDQVQDVAIGAPDENAPEDNVSENADYDELSAGDGAVTVIYGAKGQGGLNSSAHPSQFFTPANDGIDATAAEDHGSQEFGKALAAGDFNGDGADDLAIGVPGNRGGGVVVLYSAGSSGLGTARAQYWTQDSDGIEGSAENGDRFGAALAAAKFNGDRNADLAIGVPGDDDEAGAVNVIYGSGAGLGSLFNQLWNQNSPGIEGGAEGIHDNCSAGILCGQHVRGDNFGWSLAAGDFDASGRADLAIGVPYEMTDQGQPGAVAVIYSNGTSLAAGGNQFFEQGSDDDAIDGVGHGDERFGWSLAAGRFSNYGGDSLAIGVPGDDSGAGAVNVIYSSRHGLDPSTVADQRWTQNSDGIEGGQEQLDGFGTSVAAGAFRGTSDLDALAIGVPGEDEFAGAIAVIYPEAGAVIRKLRADGDQLWMQGADGIQGRAEANDHLGSALAAGDFDGNGAEDLLAGAEFEDDHAGAANAFYAVGPPHGDPTPPSISAIVSGPQGRNGWYTGDVTVRFDVSDPESLITDKSSECGTKVIRTDGVAGITCVATSTGGKSSRTVTIRRDATAPGLTATRTQANDDGWNNGDVRVEFSCSDAMSGVEDCTPPQTVSSEGRGQSVRGFVADRAGNAANRSVDAINIDKTPPTIVATRSAPVNGISTVTFTCSDELSGIRDCPAPVQVGQWVMAIRSATDRAGNTAMASG